MSTIRLCPSKKEIPVEAGQTVLAALESAGYALKNNCRAGACGECKAKVLSGSIDQGFVLDMALPQSDREQGYALTCMAKLTSDVIELEYGSENALPELFPPKENLRYLVTEKVMVSPSIAKIKMRTLGSVMKFWPGQHVMLGDESRGIPMRPYSIVNTPNYDGELVLYITKKEGGTTSVWLHDQVKLGDTLKVNGPYGSFIGDPSVERPVLCLAAGSGLAPIQSLATAAMLRGGFKQPATILFSARTREDLIDYGHFLYLKTKFRNFDFKYTLTGESGSSDDELLRGRIPEILAGLYPDLSSYSLYIAGSPEFVDDCIAAAKSLSANEDFIHVERYLSN
jgi:CDP-4-dehydro-6-deoxyglucose reductase